CRRYPCPTRRRGWYPPPPCWRRYPRGCLTWHPGTSPGRYNRHEQGAVPPARSCPTARSGWTVSGHYSCRQRSLYTRPYCSRTGTRPGRWRKGSWEVSFSYCVLSGPAKEAEEVQTAAPPLPAWTGALDDTALPDGDVGNFDGGLPQRRRLGRAELEQHLE